MSFRLVGVDLLARWYEAEPDPERQATMNEWLADPLDEPRSRSHDAVPGPNELLRVAVVPGTSWAVEFLINDGARQIELKSFIGL
ncbi:MAG: hypothetical protein R2690_19540 [Acidimicrobiales bacterium]